jgi:hypothetical protein
MVCSYTAGGVTDGSPLAPAVIIPPSPKAGGRTTNGPGKHSLIERLSLLNSR